MKTWEQRSIGFVGNYLNQTKPSVWTDRLFDHSFDCEGYGMLFLLENR